MAVIKSGKTWLLFLTLAFILAATLIQSSEGLSCYFCENCVKDKTVYYPCEEFINYKKLGPNQKLVCVKKIEDSKIVKMCGVESFSGNRKLGCDPAPAVGAIPHHCTCAEDGCNGGMKTKISQIVILGALGISLIISQVL